jgi:F-type H+-transporting ATPase subunit delta
MSLPQIARRYAKALREAAHESGGLQQAAQDMAVLAEIFEKVPGVLKWCREGEAHTASAAEFVQTAFVPLVSRLTAHTLSLAAANGRLAVLPLLPSAFAAEADSNEAVTVRLETAQSADDDLIDLVKQHVAERSGRSVVVTTFVVPSLIAGFRAFWRDRLWDGSAEGRLAALDRRLTSRGGRE